MKKKLIITLTACLLAAGSFINMHMGQNNNSTDFSLADFAIMAQALGEQFEDPIWVVTKKCYDPVPSIGCMSGGSETCLLRDHCDVD